MNDVALCGEETEVIVKSYSAIHFITWPLKITPSFLIFRVFETLPSLIHLHVLTLHA